MNKPGPGIFTLRFWRQFIWREMRKEANDCNPDEWSQLIRRPEPEIQRHDWIPKDAPFFAGHPLGELLFHNELLNTYLFQIDGHPGLVVKIIDPERDPRAERHERKTFEKASASASAVEDFLVEPVAYGVDRSTGWFGIVMPKFKEPTLYEFMRDVFKHRKTHPDGARIEGAVWPLLSLLKGLELFHPIKVHLDIKPQNILCLMDLQKVKLIDFGTARKPGRDLSAAKQSGTRFYMPPERQFDAGPVKAIPTVDLYAVGVILWQMASGWTDTETNPLIDYFQRHGHTPSEEWIRSETRREWAWAAPIIARAISSNKKFKGLACKRYDRAAKMLKDVEKALKREGIYYQPPAPFVAREVGRGLRS